MLAGRQIDGITAKGRKFVTREYVAEFQKRGLLYYVWTINEPDRILHYTHLGVDGIISDRPDRVRDLLNRRTAP
jgi:glycerophosphoryl diester phosphodiesterase